MTTDITPTTILTGVDLPLDGRGLRMGGATDLNGDGLTDLVFISGTFPPEEPIAGTPVVMINQGNGNFQQVDLEPDVSGLVHPREVEFADFNEDGFLDILIAGHGYDTHPFPGEANTLLLSTGSGTYVDASKNLPEDDTGFTHSLSVGDINGDGKQDALIGNLPGNSGPHLVLGDGTGQFTRHDLEPVRFNDGTDSWTASFFANVDADDQLELITGVEVGGPSRVYDFDTSSNRFVLQQELPVGLFGQGTTTVSDIKTADLNNDGLTDIVMAQTDSSYQGAGLQVLIQEHDGSYSDKTDTFMQGVDLGSQWIQFFEFMDVNDDGLADIVTDRSSVNGPNAFINTGGHFVPVTADVSIWNAVEFYTLLDPNNETVWGIKPYDNTLEIAEIPLSFYGANISVRNEAGIVRAGTEAGDTINGGAARDNLNGSLGNDRVEGYSGNDALRGGRGLDTLVGGAQNDTLDGGIGHDKLFGNHGLDVLRGGSGNETVNAGIGRDKLFGNHGRDILRAGSGNDTLDGGVGHDKLFGERGMDVLRGGSGNDTLNGGGGRDRLFGGAGSDTFVFGANSGNDVVRDFVAGEDSVHITSGATSFADLTFENHGEDVKVLFGNSSILFRVSEIDAIMDADNFLF